MYYTDSHEWVEISKGQGKVGITKHAQKELGEIIYVELPKIGNKIKAGEEICVLESTKAAADVYAPLTGVVCAVNEVLVKNPHALNQDPEGAGWLFQMDLSDVHEVDRLLSLEEYRSLIYPR